MTRKRWDGHSTEFGLWLREQKEIDSGLGFVTTNLDYIWENYKTGQWCFLEEKRYNSRPAPSQLKQFVRLHKLINDTKYLGFFVLVFENTTPEDGAMWLCQLCSGITYQQIDKPTLMRFLTFFDIPPKLVPVTP